MTQQSLINLAAVAIGGALGSSLRYLMTIAMLRGDQHNYATFVVNILGSFLMGFIASLTTSSLSPTMRLALTTGLLGGFTTYSTFSLDKLKLVERGMIWQSFFYAFITLIVGFIGVYAGAFLARSFNR